MIRGLNKMSQYLKILENGNISTHQNFAWPLLTQNEDGTWVAGEWVEVEGEAL
jgi:hypothetical protein